MSVEGAVLRGLMVFLLVLVVAGGCATSADRQDRLDRTLRAYGKAVRWGRFDAAAAFLAPGAPLAALPPGLRVTGYEVLSGRWEDGGRRWRQRVRIRYYSEEDARERTLEREQSWVYDEAAGRWRLESGLPELR